MASSIRSTPVPIRSSPRSTSNEIQDRMGNTLREFAPEGLNIEVVAEYGGNETTIKLGKKCYNVRQTSLDDKVHNGSSVWTLSSECGDTSGYAEQLEASLNKYIDR
ncbi:hypothetical protein [Alteromonas sp. KUL49]|uniref:hypothetical protein n=1 Tax=Alteromonas sp. KUL49 TaxID=2480798 RepID=UPI00102EE957|nr:hypothetical protein [Alteromonas sp. KUL49]TAP35819.1 hypothetical protein EYS00_17590 [Alteromonas sp. KUL49]